MGSFEGGRKRIYKYSQNPFQIVKKSQIYKVFGTIALQ